MVSTIPVYLELGKRRVFAGAMDWPGWCRSGRDEAAALQALVDAATRYAGVAREAGTRFRTPNAASELEVMERLGGNATTDFGAPGAPPSVDAGPVTPAQLRRLQRLLRASWSALDRAAAAAKGNTLRKGPRGGGRDLPKIVSHVVEAERGYLTSAGGRFRADPAADLRSETERLRQAILDTVAARARGDPVPQGRRATVWTPRYAVRRIAWHTLDHAWEIEDRAERTGPDRG